MNREEKLDYEKEKIWNHTINGASLVPEMIIFPFKTIGKLLRFIINLWN